MNLLKLSLVCFGGGGAPNVIPPPAVASESDPEVQMAAQDAAEKAKAAERKRKGRASTILTTPEGLGSSGSSSSMGLRTLLGG